VGERQDNLASDLWNALQSLRSERIYANGKSLFEFGQPSQGIYLLEEGEVRLIFQSGKDRPKTFETVGPGAILGLCEAMCGGPHQLCAEARGQAQVSFVERGQLLRILKNKPEFCMQVVRMLSEDLHVLYYHARAEGAGQRSRKGKPALREPSGGEGHI